MTTERYDLAEKIAKLIAEVGNPSTERLAEDIKTQTGTSISGAYLWQLKKGKRSNLTLQHLTALSSYFSMELGVSITLQYFDPGTPVDDPWRESDEALDVAELRRQLAEEREFSAVMGDHGIRRIAQRLGQMDAAQRRQLLAIADAISGLDKDTDVDDSGGTEASAGENSS